MLQRYSPLRRTPFQRKPPKTKVIVRDDGREILTGEAWETRREECFHREHGMCEGCRKFAPLHDTVKTPHPWALPVIDKAGHAHHKRLRSGGRRDDRLANLSWLCHFCHDSVHKPKKVVPRKGDRTMRTVKYALGLLILSMLPLATPPKPVHAATVAVKPQPLPIQTVTFNAWQLPVYVDVTPVLGGFTYDVFMAPGACTQQSVNPQTPRVAFDVDSYTATMTAYGTYCFYVNAWTPGLENYVTATILTTVKIVQVAPPATMQPNTANAVAQFNTTMQVHN